MKSFKTRIYLDEATQQYCERAFGVRRFLWNWALNEFLVSKAQTGQLPETYGLAKKYRAAVAAKQDSGFEWLSNQLVSGRVMEETFKDIKAAFALCRTEQKSVDKQHIRSMHKPAKYSGKRGWHKVQPHFQKRKQLDKQSFRYYNSCAGLFRLDGDYTISFTASSRKQRGKVRTRESLAFLRADNVKICTFTISREAGKYWICITYEKPNREVVKPIFGKVGIDLGVVVSACTFDGARVQNVSFNTKRSLKLDRASKALDESLSRKTYGSSRYMRELLLKQKRSAKAARIRKEELEKYTTFLVENYKEIIIDDFSFKGALYVANPDKAYRSIVYQFKLRLEEKAQEHGNEIRYVEHEKKQKTTHRCSQCGSVAVSVDKKARTMHCRNCQHRDDRDANAAMCTYKYY